MRPFQQVIAAASLVALVTLPAGAQTDDKTKKQPDPILGKQTIVRLCTTCHIVPGEPRSSAQVDIPTFNEIANLPAQTAQRITNKLINPHPPMTDTKLTRDEIQNIVAYLDTLRKKSSGAPLLPPKAKDQKKPFTKSTHLESAPDRS